MCGTVIPSGIYTDLGTKGLRELLFTQATIDCLFGLSNERFIFEGVDHRFKVAILTFLKGGITQHFRAAFRADPREAVAPNVLERFLQSPEEHVKVGVDLLRRLSPDSLSIMEFKGDLDVHIAEKMLRFPLLGEEVPGKWALRLTQELNMTSDSYLFHRERGKGMLPLYEGKLIHQFTHQWEGASVRYWVDEQEARQTLIGKRGTDTGQRLNYQRYRVSCRAVGRSTDSHTMIATAIPKDIFCGNSLLVAVASESGQSLDGRQTLVCAALLNSLMVDYMLRQKMSANVNMFYIYQLSVPRLTTGDPYFDALVSRAARLICTTPEFDDLAREVGLGDHRTGVTDVAARARLRAEIDGIVAHLYGLSEAEFVHILGTFPLVPEPVKLAALEAFRDVERGVIR